MTLDDSNRKQNRRSFLYIVRYLYDIDRFEYVLNFSNTDEYYNIIKSNANRIDSNYTLPEHRGSDTENSNRFVV